MDSLEALNAAIIGCDRCPRLRDWCRKVALEKRASFRNESYWGLPVPIFGDPEATRLIVGLAPAAHGANRTGRMFTGDRSGEWLYRALFKAGVANQPESRSVDDGLALHGVLVTAVVHCAPPANKPLPEEADACRPYLEALLRSRRWSGVLCLGALAWQATHRCLGEKPLPAFSHAAEHRSRTGALIVASYHPSQQNTFTGRLTEPMLDDAIRRFVAASR